MDDWSHHQVKGRWARRYSNIGFIMASITIPATELLEILENKEEDGWVKSMKELCDIGIISSRPIALSLEDIERIGFDEFK